MGSEAANPRMEVVTAWKDRGSYRAYEEILLWQNICHVHCSEDYGVGELPWSIGDDS